MMATIEPNPIDPRVQLPAPTYAIALQKNRAIHTWQGPRETLLEAVARAERLAATFGVAVRVWSADWMIAHVDASGVTS